MTLAIFLLFPQSAMSQNTWIDYCEHWSEFAGIQMQLRQDGFPVRTAFQSVKDMAIALEFSDSEFEMAMKITEFAFRRDLEPTQRLAEIAIYEFRDRFLVGCVSGQ